MAITHNGTQLQSDDFEDDADGGGITTYDPLGAFTEIDDFLAAPDSALTTDLALFSLTPNSSSLAALAFQPPTCSSWTLMGRGRYSVRPRALG